jgi:phage virion morphogenesis protein
MIEIKVTVKDEGVRRLLQRIGERASDLTPAMRLVGDIIVGSVERNFEQKRSPEGKSWQPVSERYADWKSRHGRNPSDILILNRILMGSLNRKASTDKVAVGVNTFYAAIHQYGGKTGRKHAADMPARPYLGVRDEDWPRMTDVLAKYRVKLA